MYDKWLNRRGPWNRRLRLHTKRDTKSKTQQ